MRIQLAKLALTAAFGLAIALAFSCSSGKDEDTPGNSSSTVMSSSSGNSSSSGIGSSSSSGGSGSSSSETGNLSSSDTPSSSSLYSSGSQAIGPEYGEPITDRDGQTYQTVVIGGQVWMAKNLNFEAEGSKCGNGNTLSDENTATCNAYGRLYNWATAMGLPYKCNGTSSTDDSDCAITTPYHQGICPDGWHLPSNAEWIALLLAAGGLGDYGQNGYAGTKLKATSSWNTMNGYIAGTDDYGFAALPGGSGDTDGNRYQGFDLHGYWWTATEGVTSNRAYRRQMSFNDDRVGRADGIKYMFWSVRCVKN